MVKAIKKYLPKVAWFFVITASVVTLWDLIFSDIVSFTSILKYWILTAIVVIITLLATGELKAEEVKEKATNKAKELNGKEKAKTVYSVIYAILIFVAVVMLGTVLAVKFHWNNAVTYWIALKVDEIKFLIWDVVLLVITFFVERITD